MKLTLKALATALLISASAAAMAASSVDLSVKGVITPNACTPSLSGGGVVDYGKISAKDLNLLHGPALRQPATEHHVRWQHPVCRQGHRQPRRLKFR